MKKLLGYTYRISSIAVLIFTIIFVFYGYELYETNSSDIIKYLVYQFIFIYIQGSIFNRICKLKIEGLERLILSYGAGVIISTLEYPLFFYINSDPVFVTFGVLLLISEIYFVIQARKANMSILILKEIPATLLLVLSIMILVTLFGFILSNPLPNIAGAMTYYQDFLWNIGNVQSILRGIFPIEDSRVAEVPLYYHLFGSIHLASISQVTRIDAVDVFFKYAQLGKMFFIVVSAYLLGLQIFLNKKKAAFFTWVYFLTSCASLTSILNNGYGYYLNVNFLHISVNPIGFQLSISFLFLAVVMLIKQFREESLRLNYLLLFLLFCIGCIWTKGPVGAILVGVLLTISALFFLRKEESNSTVLLYSFALTGLFIFIYIVFERTSTSSLGFQLGYTVRDTIVWQSIVELFNYNRFGEWLIVPAILVHLFLFLPFGFYLFCYWFFKKIKGFYHLSIQDLIIGGIAICGISGTLIVKQNGHSEIYFLLAAIPFIELAALSWLFENYRRIAKIHVLFIFILFGVGSISSFTNVFLQIEKGRNMVERIEGHGRLNLLPSDSLLTFHEYEAMNWLKNNTQRESIIATNRHYHAQVNDTNHARYFYYSTFSDRKYFLEGWSYYYTSEEFESVPDERKLLNEKIFSNHPDTVRIFKENEIDYIVLSKFVNPELELTYPYISQVFSNRDIIIYKVNSDLW